MVEISENPHLGPTVYAHNTVNAEVVDFTKRACEIYNSVRVSFEVIGRTKHKTLGYQLARELGDDYSVLVEDNYRVIVTKREG